ncbi:Putative thiol:disulfide oxidoreductase involved in cytochrome C-type biogenesis [Methanosarcina lacustris Z-7289]|uniref:Putative thiol:disulfide oxidoreductase involved in cytochrome C-type biogenesis n=1 Tax=Methanosarcina lacustris Z-7289 TaxID=1434111 RepID=A0A0E3S6E3_9EURY|nr:thioredoxin family protein [Methanosarcina lacustris]AKB76056.1 Putative thiol:disulfide oxidoreductase involved in cytochrome C-type biogenesis [Methanosarcina lacustris Z-7289]
MNKLIILLILLAAVLFTAGCTENPKNTATELAPDFKGDQGKSVVANLTDLEQINTSVQTGPVFVKLGSEGCDACREMKPILNDMAAKYGGRATVMSVDIEKSPQLAAYFGAYYIPDSFVVVGVENGEYVYMQEDGNVTTDRSQARVQGLTETHVYEELMERAILYHENAK